MIRTRIGVAIVATAYATLPNARLEAQDVSNEKAALTVQTSHAALRQHALFVDKFGRPLRIAVSPTPQHEEIQVSTRDVMHREEYDQYLHQMMGAIRARPDLPILIYAHGGLVGLRGSLQNDTAWYPEILSEGSYPIFLNWHSALGTTLGEHLCCLAQGHRSRGYILLSPLRVAQGLVSSVNEAIPSWGSQVMDGAAPALERWGEGPQHQQLYQALRQEFHDSTQIKVSLGSVDRLPPAWFRVPAATATAPFRAIGSPFVAGFGAPAWDNMLRRIKLLFRGYEEGRTSKDAARDARTDYIAPSGAVSLLMDSLSAVLRESPDRRVVLIGHSMGAIVMTELIQRYPDLPVSDIVYMAAANSVRDLETSVIPFMQRHPSTRLYLLSLHPRADQREKAAGTDFAPGGSLLEYLDDYLTKPHTRMDRRLGKFRNIMEHHHIFPNEIRGRVHIKGFGIGDSTVLPHNNKPTRHGHFNDPDVPFWRQEFWKPVPPA